MKEKSVTEPACAKPLTFGQLIRFVRQSAAPLRRDEIQNLLSGVFIAREDYEQYVADAEPYGRVSVVKSEFDCAELLVMTWKEGQESAIHDHYKSACGIRILEGTLSETLYELVTSNKVRRLTVREFSEGEITSSEADFDIHKVSNTREKTLITLHVYSVPLDVNRIRRFSSP